MRFPERSCRRAMRRSTFLSVLAILVIARGQAPAPELKLPLAANSVRFVVIGDSGTGDRPQYEVGEQMARYHASFPFDFVLMMGDNIYGSRTPAHLKRKF